MKKNVLGLFVVICLVSIIFVVSGFAESLSPQDVYKKHWEAERAGNLDLAMEYETQKASAQIQAMGDKEKEMMSQMMKGFAPAEYSVKSEDIQENEVTLKIEGSALNIFTGENSKMLGTVSLLKENGEWKISELKYDAAE